ncbi:MAG: hypothetical protein FWC26_02100 [Fibromonadales bacterium]|nr:hypothetical protein [Fibromonadales bacterium]
MLTGEDHMLIANPIYDTVFKHLLENKRVAKFFISTLLNKTVHSIELRTPEHTYIDKKNSELRLLRLDFIVEIEEKNGKRSKIIIEMQKADKYDADLVRFRKYLGREYMEDILPITSIYILGFNLPGIETACLRIGRGYYDLIEERTMEASANFVESLTHDCYIVQTSRITGRLRTPLDRLLSVFEQKNFMDKTQASKRYDHPISDEEIKEIVDILHYLSVDPDGRKELDDEQYYREYLDATFGPLYAKIDEKTQKLVEKETEIAAREAELSVKDAEITAKDAELSVKDAEIAAKDAEISAKDTELAELKRKLELALS